MKIAIVGGGYAGLASAFKLSKNVISINIFDRTSVGFGGASAVSAGLLHPLSPQGRLLWRGAHGYESTKELLDVASKYDKNVYSQINLFRPIISDKQHTIWNKAAVNLPEWLESVDLSEYSQQTGVRDLNPNTLAAVRIRNALLVDSPLYLQALWRAISDTDSLKTEWHVASDVDVQQLSAQFDAVILSCGADIDRLWSSGFDQSSTQNSPTTENGVNNHNSATYMNNIARRLNITLNESRNLLFAPPHGPDGDQDPLLDEGTGLLCGEYVVHRTVNGQRVVMVGAAHKQLSRDSHYVTSTDESSHSEQSVADADTFRDVVSAKLLPSLRHLSPVGSSRGVKVLTPRSSAGRLPFVGRHPCLRNVWMVAGFGSRGLVHHATAAEILAEAILSGDEGSIPSELSVKYVGDKII
jgi:glycine/D-amino acid oxidase-like deaminating enzyme